MTSRVRRLDKSILQVESNEGEEDGSPILMDIEDQNQLIQDLSISNQVSFVQFQKFLIVLILIEIPIHIILHSIARHQQGKSIRSNVANLLILCSFVLSLTMVLTSSLPLQGSIKYLESLDPKIRWGLDKIKYVNGIICAQVFYLFINGGEFKWTLNLNYILPIINYIMIVFANMWFIRLDNDVKDLIKLRYKYKNV
ncbi:uncharacterized protein RJT21DRAFT_111872 [Scheffersomyces amazonensis]|uniref:uncharacterized protein n=1 Tax=Scheffersomyces amazonensis TaxID=1078765 RepID=UPI00315DAECD